LFPPFVGFVVTSVLALRLRRWRARFFEAERRELWFDAPLSEAEFLNRMTVSLVVGMVVAAIGGGLWWRWRRSRVTPGVQFLVALGIMVGMWAALGILPWATDIAFDALLPLIAF